ncbi:LysR family transcriptional regulator [Alcanivorax sp. 1008]|uniref:LysR family transcriptional regulator n=1 Tax=Alcanivorax sp. 1008 TaxID=2816853 RepID=UPI001D760781|nr:LysR family transcriptional regulator [Alcanivorax sp. 1008]MCC1495396.1 LysR family transcriptional regulator [Alcanivorax sp. 1008]
MDTRQLQHFLALLEHSNFARAADAVHLSQPAFSRSIQQLEQQLGVSLFDRGRHGASPTVYARAALPHVRALFAAREALMQEIQAVQGLETGELAVGTGPYPAIGLMDHIAAGFVDRYPGIRLRLHTANWEALRHDLLAHEIELFVADTRELSEDPALTITPLPQPAGVIFCRHDHPLAGRGNLQWSALLQFPFALTRLPDAIEATLQQLSAPHGGLTRRIECDNVAMLVAMVAGSDAISMAPVNVIRTQLAAGSLIDLPVQGVEQIQTRYGLVHRRERQLSPAASAFRQLLLQAATDTAA